MSWKDRKAFSDEPIVEAEVKLTEDEELILKRLPVACGYWDAARKAGMGWECELLLEWVFAERKGDLEFFKTNREKLKRICDDLKPIVLREKEKPMIGEELVEFVKGVFKDEFKDGRYRG